VVPRRRPWPPAPSPSPTSSDDGFRRRRPPFISASTAVGSSTPSPPSLGDRRFVVVDREEEEEVKKKMISLWKKQGKAGRATGRGSYIDKTRNRQAPLPPPTTPLLPVRATRLRIGLRFGRKTMCRLSIMREGEGARQ
jgi:hypothetical protein